MRRTQHSSIWILPGTHADCPHVLSTAAVCGLVHCLPIAAGDLAWACYRHCCLCCCCVACCLPQVVTESHSVLVFCSGRQAPKSCAEMLSTAACVRSRRPRARGACRLLQVVAESHSVLVFCSGRQASKSCAEMLSRELVKRLGPPSAAAAAARADLIEQLRIALSGSSDEKFEQLLGK